MLAWIPQIPGSWFFSTRLCFSQLLLFSFFMNFCMMQHLSFFFSKRWCQALMSECWCHTGPWYPLVGVLTCSFSVTCGMTSSSRHLSCVIIIECLSVTSLYHDTKVFCSKQTLVIRRQWDLRLCLVEFTLIISITTSLIIWKTALIEAKGVL